MLPCKHEVFTLPEEDVALRALAVNEYPSDLRAAISLAVETAQKSPCQKSKRGAVAFARRRSHQPGDSGRVITCYESGYNRPFTSASACSGSAACKAACRHLCDHAEAIAVSKWVSVHAADVIGSGMFDVVHIELRPNDDGKWEPVAFDREGQPKDPSCITCARDMLRAEVRLVWLWGTAGWRWWYAQDFFRDTLEGLKLVESAMLPPRIAASGR